jgi:hypothetical protein
LALKELDLFLKQRLRELLRVERLQIVRLPGEPDDFAAFHQNRTDHRIRRSCAVATPGEAEGKAHELGFRHSRAS